MTRLRFKLWRADGQGGLICASARLPRPFHVTTSRVSRQKRRHSCAIATIIGLFSLYRGLPCIFTDFASRRAAMSRLASAGASIYSLLFYRLLLDYVNMGRIFLYIT